MQEITAQEFEAAYSEDALSEAFEVFVQQKAYFEVLNVTSGIVAHLDRFSQGEFHNASGWFHHDGEYAFEKAEREGKLQITYYRFDTMAEAVKFAAELLTEVEEGC